MIRPSPENAPYCNIAFAAACECATRPGRPRWQQCAGRGAGKLNGAVAPAGRPWKVQPA